MVQRRRRPRSGVLNVLTVAASAILVVNGVGRPPGPTAAPECALIPDPGNCKGFFRRFYYDRWTGKCSMFVYGGCKGVVPFLIQKDCEEAKCFLMFPKSGLDDSTRPPDLDPAFHRRSAVKQAPALAKDSERTSNDGGAYHVVSVRATVVLL